MNRIGMIGGVLAVVLLVLAPVASDAILEELVPKPGTTALAKHMPSDSTLVVSMNVGKLAEAGLFDMIQGMGDGEGLEKLEGLGIDLEEDITEIMIGLVFAPDADEPEAYVAIAGELPKEKILEAYEEEMDEAPGERKVGEHTVYEMDETEVCFLPGLVLLCPSDDGEADISKMLNAKGINVELAGLMKNVNTKGTAWVVASLSQQLRDAIAEDEEEEAEEEEGEFEEAPTALKLSALKTAVASFDYDEKVALDVALGWTSDKPANEIVTMFAQQVKPMAEMMPPELAKLINAVKVGADGSKTTVKLSMAREDFDAAIEGLGAMMMGPMFGPEEDDETEW